MQKRTVQRCIISRKQDGEKGRLSSSDISGVTSRTKNQITALLRVFRGSYSYDSGYSVTYLCANLSEYHLSDRPFPTPYEYRTVGVPYDYRIVAARTTVPYQYS